MSNTELKILFPTEKLDALRFFIGKKDLTVKKRHNERFPGRSSPMFQYMLRN